MSTVWISKLACRLPQLLARAAAGDPTAIAMLVALGGGALYCTLKDK